MNKAASVAVWISTLVAVMAAVLVVAPAAQAQPSECDSTADEAWNGDKSSAERGGFITVGAPGEPLRQTFSEPGWRIDDASDVDWIQFETNSEGQGLAQFEVLDDRGQPLTVSFESNVIYPWWDTGMPDDTQYVHQGETVWLRISAAQGSSGCYRVNVLTEGEPLADITEPHFPYVPTWTTSDGRNGPLECGPDSACTGSGVYSTRIPLSLQPWGDEDYVHIEVPEIGDVFREARPVEGDCHTYLAPDPFSPTGQSRYTMSGLMTVRVGGGVNSRSTGPADMANVPVNGVAYLQSGNVPGVGILMDFDDNHVATVQCPGQYGFRSVSMTIGEYADEFNPSETAYNGFAMGGYWIDVRYELSFHKESSTRQFDDHRVPCFDEFSFGGNGQFGYRLPNDNFAPNNGLCGELPPGFGPDDLPDFPELPGLGGPGEPFPGPFSNPGF